MKRATVALLLSGLFALLTLGLSGCGSGSSAPPAIGVKLTPSGTKSVDQAQTVAITAAVANDSKNAGVTWTVSGTNGSQGTLTNTSTTAATYNAPASVTNAFTATVTATSITDTTKLSTLTLNVNPLPSITTTSLAAATAGTAYNATLVETGGSSPYTWSVTSTPPAEKRARVRPSVVSSTLPAGLSLNSSTGVISGTPTGGGSGSYTFTVTDATGMTSSQAITITINPPPALTVTTTTLPAAVMGTAYPQTQLTATGGVQPYTWSVPPGTLPAGLTLSSAGVISGTPTGLVTGPIGFTVTVTDVETPTNATAPASLSIAVSAPLLSVTTSSLPGGTMNNVYSSQTLQAKGGAGADAWKLASGSGLPAGLTLSPAGVIAGTPSGNFVGTTYFTVVVTDSETPTPQTATAALSIAITVAPLTVATSGSLTTGVANSVYPGVTLLATGGIQPYINWTVVGGNANLPPGLTLNPATGVISGTPTTAGTTNFTVTVTDSEATPKTATSATLSITVNPALSVTTTSLPAGVVGTSYPAGTTLQAAGGTSPYSWSITTGSLPAGLSLTPSTGAITGKPTGPAVGTISFTVTVTDSESPSKTATQNLSIAITAPPLTVTTTTASLPTGVINNTYPGTLQASGGVVPYSWSLTGGSLPTGLSLNSNGTFSGTLSATGTFSFTVTVTDSETPTVQTASASLSISVNNSAPLSVTTTSSQLPAGLTGNAYPSTTLQATGGVPPYTWSYTGSLPTGLNLSASGAITGIPSAAGTFNFTVKVTDSTKPTPGTATANLSITVTTPTPLTLPPSSSLANAVINQSYTGAINASGGVGPNYTFTVNGSAVPTSGTAVSIGSGLTVSNTGGNTLSIGGTPTSIGTVSFTVAVTDSASDNAGPNTYTIAVFSPGAAYTVSGTVSYSGSKTGWTYLELYSNNCGGCNNNNGTSISEATLTSGGAFTIHGVPPGTYTLQAFMDNLGYGAQNASNPTGSIQNVTVTNEGLSGLAVVLTDPPAVTLSTAPTWNSSNGSGAFSGGAFVSFQTIQNSNGIEMPASYTVEWSTSSSFTTVTGSKSFAATGGNNPWIVNGLTNGTTYYFRAQGVAGSSTSAWSSASSATTIDAPAGGYAVSGTVTFSETATGPLYVGFYDQNTGNVYADVVGSKASPPKSPASYSVNVPAGSNYYFFGIIDQNNSGLISGPGQVSNTNGNNSAPVVISGTTTGENLTLPNANSTATVMTQNSEQINQNGTSSGYSIGFNVNGLLKLPVAVEIATESDAGVVIPADIATGGFNGNSDRFSFWTGLNGATPKVGDTYTLDVTYSDGTTQVLTVTVSAVLDSFATNLSPQGTGASLTPNFSWTDPANASNYTYQFWLCCNSNNNGNNTIWQIPGNNSNSNGFSSSITSIIWGTDPTNPNNTPNVSSLNGSTNYNWQIQATDINGNSAQVQVSFETLATPLTLPTPGSVGTAVIGQGFNGAINASGGVGPNYTFTVNGSAVPTDGTQVSLGDGLYAYNTGGNSLSLTGTPTGATTVSFTVAVTDSASDNAGPYTYSITVSAAAALSIETMSMPGGNNGWPYTSSVKATGGVQPYNWSIISGSLPSNLTFSSNGGSNLNITGTPNGTGTASFTVQVADSETPPVTVTQALTITITSCTYTALSGNYAFMSNGWDSSGSTLGASAIGSFVANGSGTISSGLIDVSDQANSGPQSGTFTGTYCVGSNNLALISLNYAGGLSGSNTFAASLDASDGNGHLISYDTSNLQVSGVLRKQTTSAFLTSKIDGNYAFGIVGVNQNYNRLGLAGEFTSNGSGSLTGQADYDMGCSSGCGSDNSGNTTISSSDFTVASTGRGTASLYVTAPAVTVNFVFYVVSSSEMLMMAYDDTETPSIILAGQVLQQSGSLSNASLKGYSVIEMAGLDNSSSPGVPDVQAGIINASGSGGFSLTMDENDGGTFDSGTGSPATISGDYSVGTGGRVTLSNITGCPGGCGSHNPVFYLVGLNQAFVIDTGGEVSFGTITPQTGSNFGLTSLSGSYQGGSEPPVILNNGEEVDSLSANGAGTFSITTDKNSGCQGCGSSNLGSQGIQGLEYSVSTNGRVLVTCGPTSGGNCGPSGTQAAIVYMISDEQIVLLVIQDSNPRLGDFHQ